MKLFEIKVNKEAAWNEKFEKDCAFYLEQLGASAKTLRMYRGTESERIKVGELNPFRPRVQPVDMPKSVHTELNSFFKKSYGQPFRNGLFVSGSTDMAEAYGELYVVVPAGKFEWVCSKKYEDLYQNGIVDAVEDEDDEEQVEEAADELIEVILDTRQWINNKDLVKCVKSNKELMLWCPGGYYLFDPEMFLPNALKK